MKFLVGFLLIAIMVSAVLGDGNEIIDSNLVTRFVRSVPNGKLFLANATDSNDLTVTLPILHLYGSTYEMGFAHGQLMKEEITTLLFKELPFFYQIIEMNKAVDNEYLPDDIRDMLQKAKGDDIPVVMLKVLTWIWDTQFPYFEKYVMTEEIDAIVDGYCHDDDKCDKNQARYVIRAQNLLPELVRMACSIMSSWGSANAAGHENTLQLRALDFGPGPFAKSQVLIVRHPTGAQPFASLFFPGAVGVVTSVSPSIAQAEKIWESHDARAEHPRMELLRSVGLDMAPHAKAVRPGTYDGISDIFAIRAVIERAQTPGEALDMVRAFKRTWPVFLGFAGPVTAPQTMPVATVAYESAAVTLIDGGNNEAFTGTPALRDLIYLDKFVQPSTETPVLYRTLQAQHGNLTAEWVVRHVPAAAETGDVHIMVVDWNQKHVFVSVGYAPNFTFGPDGKAYQRPFLRFAMDQLWGEPRPQQGL